MLAQSCPHPRSCPKARGWTLTRRCYASGVLELSSFSITTSILRAPNYLWSRTCDPSHLALPPFLPCCPLVSPIPKANGQFCLMWKCTLVCFMPRLQRPCSTLRCIKKSVYAATIVLDDIMLSKMNFWFPNFKRPPYLSVKDKRHQNTCFSKPRQTRACATALFPHRHPSPCFPISVNKHNIVLTGHSHTDDHSHPTEEAITSPYPGLGHHFKRVLKQY